MIWVKAWHVIFMVTWFAGLFYLPRLFVYHAACEDEAGNERFKVMERKLYAIMTLGAILTAVFGLWLLYGYAWQAYSSMLWLHLKLTGVVVLIGYHLYCQHLVKVFREDRNERSHVFYRWFNEAPVLLLIAIILSAVAKPI